MLKLSFGIIVLFLFIDLAAQRLPSVKDLEKSGTQSLARDDFDSVISDFTKVIELTSRIEVKGRSLRSEFAEPEVSAEDALARDSIRVIDPRTAVAYVNRGRAYFGKGET